MQKMLTIAESGWNEDIKETEHPFGMGFLSAIFAARHVKIESRGKKMEFDTEHALNFRQVDIVKSNFIGGTRITMSGFAMALPGIEGALANFAKAFPIGVYLNGKLFEAPRSELNLRGLIEIPGIGKVALGTYDKMCVYLQGLPVYMPSFEDDASIVHLDSRLFYAKMPDRNVLIDQDEQLQKVSHAIREQWRTRLLAAKREMTASHFVESYWAIAERFGIMEVMNDVPVIPAAALSVINAPSQISFADRLSPAKSDVTQEAVESGAIVLCMNSASYLEGKNMVATLFAHKKGWLEVDSLPDGHWANFHVVDLDEVEPELQYEALAEAVFNGNYVGADLIVCDEYRIKVGEDVITVDDMAVAYGEDRYDCTILVPSESDGTEALEQASDFEDEWDTYMESDHDEEKEAIAGQVRILLGEDPCITMGKVLSEGNIDARHNVLGRLFLVQARAATSRGYGDYVVDASFFLGALKAAESALSGIGNNDSGAMDKIQVAIKQIGEMHHNAILDLAAATLYQSGHYGLKKDDDLVRHVTSHFQKEIAGGSHTIQTVADTVQHAINTFAGGVSQK